MVSNTYTTNTIGPKSKPFSLKELEVALDNLLTLEIQRDLMKVIKALREGHIGFYNPDCEQAKMIREIIIKEVPTATIIKAKYMPNNTVTVIKPEFLTYDNK